MYESGNDIALLSFLSRAIYPFALIAATFCGDFSLFEGRSLCFPTQAQLFGWEVAGVKTGGTFSTSFSEAKPIPL